jgi:hypothetical protein
MGILSTPSIKRSVKFFVTTILLGFLLPGMIYAQATGDLRSRTTGVAWNLFTSWERYNGSTWVVAVAGETPNSTTNVLIRNGHTINANTTAMSCKNLVVGEGATGILAITNAITVFETTTITAGGRINVTSTTGTKFFTGDFTNNGIWSNTGNSPITFTGSVTNNGTFTSGSGAYSFSGLSKSINTTNSSALTITAITWLGSYTVSANFAAGNPFTVTTATLSNAASSLTNNGFAQYLPWL